MRVNLLIADDETIILNGLASLNWAGIGVEKVRTASDGIEAQRLLLSEPIDVLLCDIRMPEMNGIELSKYIHDNQLDVAVVFLSGLSQFDYALAALRNGVSDYLLKPVKEQDLMATVARVFEQLTERRGQRAQLGERLQAGEAANQTLEALFPRVRRDVLDVLKYLDQHYAQDVSLQGLAQAMHFSMAYLSKLIHRETGRSFSTLLTGIRLYRAQAMLVERGVKVQEVCARMGFVNQHYFSSVFKRAFGVTPKAFQRLGGPRRRLEELLDSTEGEDEKK